MIIRSPPAQDLGGTERQTISTMMLATIRARMRSIILMSPAWHRKVLNGQSKKRPLALIHSMIEQIDIAVGLGALPPPMPDILDVEDLVVRSDSRNLVTRAPACTRRCVDGSLTALLVELRFKSVECAISMRMGCLSDQRVLPICCHRLLHSIEQHPRLLGALLSRGEECRGKLQPAPAVADTQHVGNDAGFIRPNSEVSFKAQC